VPAARSALATCASASSAATATLNRRDADAQAGKRPGARRDREQIDVGPCHAVRGREIGELRWQAFRVGSRSVAAPLVDDAIVFDERHAPLSRRRVKRQHAHRTSISFQLSVSASSYQRSAVSCAADRKQKLTADSWSKL